MVVGVGEDLVGYPQGQVDIPPPGVPRCLAPDRTYLYLFIVKTSYLNSF